MWKTHGYQCWTIRNHRIVSARLRCWSGTSTSNLPKSSLGNNGNTTIVERLRCCNSLQIRVSTVQVKQGPGEVSFWLYDICDKFNQQNLTNTECSWFMHIISNSCARLAKLFTFFVLLPPRLLWSLDRLNVTQFCCRVTKGPASRAGLEPESCLPRPFLVRLNSAWALYSAHRFKQKPRIRGKLKSWNPWNLDLLGTLDLRSGLN